MVFDLTEGKFCFYDGGKWYVLNEWVKEAGSNDVSVNGTVTAPNYALNAHGNGPIPAGGIIMWSGSIAAIPTGWALCDGSNGTVDLRNKFIVGAGSTYAVKGQGGNNTILLTREQIPHHDHTGSTSYEPDHQHKIYGMTMQKEGESTKTVKVLDTGTDPNRGDYEEWTSSAGAHTHYVATAYTNGTTNQGTPVDIRPLYFALAYIMKLP
jgi:microcystin-dependent protein